MRFEHATKTGEIKLSFVLQVARISKQNECVSEATYVGALQAHLAGSPPVMLLSFLFSLPALPIQQKGRCEAARQKIRFELGVGLGFEKY